MQMQVDNTGLCWQHRFVLSKIIDFVKQCLTTQTKVLWHQQIFNDIGNNNAQQLKGEIKYENMSVYQNLEQASECRCIYEGTI